jgi:hypothetical protein
MSMTKKERAEFDAAILRAETLAALRWTEPVERDLPAPGYRDGVSQGWDFNAHGLCAYEAWSSCVSRGTGQHAILGRSSGSQGSRSLFSTEEKALRALRHALEQEAAARLRKVDAMLAARKGQK